MKTQLDDYLEKFFDEKEIPFTMFNLKSARGVNHVLSTDIIIETIKNTSAQEKKAVVDVLRELDFHNAPILPFLKHLAQGLVSQTDANSIT